MNIALPATEIRIRRRNVSATRRKIVPRLLRLPHQQSRILMKRKERHAIGRGYSKRRSVWLA
jgi:hypothetical protein